MGREEILHFLTDRGIWFEVREHRAVFRMEEVLVVDMPYREASAKNLFLRDDKGRNFYLITVKGNKRVDLKGFRRVNHTRPLSFASEGELLGIMGLRAGAVTPFGVLNDEERRVRVFVDRDFFEAPGLIGVHPNDNRATVWLGVRDLVEVIREHGNVVEVVAV